MEYNFPLILIPSIHFLNCLSWSGSRGTPKLSQGFTAQGRGTRWTGHQPFTGQNHTHYRQFRDASQTYKVLTNSEHINSLLTGWRQEFRPEPWKWKAHKLTVKPSCHPTAPTPLVCVCLCVHTSQQPGFLLLLWHRNAACFLSWTPEPLGHSAGVAGCVYILHSTGENISLI